MYKPNILGISGSLRNARYGKGSEILLSELKQIKTKSSYQISESQTKIRINDILQSETEINLDKTYKTCKS